MKRLIPLALVALALSAVPIAFGDNGNNPPATGTTQAGQTQRSGDAGKRFQNLRDHLKIAGLRFAKHCGSSANGAPQKCIDFATKVEQGLQKLDTNIQARIAKIEQTCSATGTSSTTTTTTTTSTTPTTTPPTRDRCANADKRIALLQKIDTRVQALVVKVQGWLSGTSSTTSSSTTNSTSDSTLDQAATGLGQLAQQSGVSG
jgi:hypothetical protein